MTIEGDNSIYVGGLPYDCTDSQLRRAFELHGSILAVKIINERDVGGKCYGFITFTNPRSAVEAINEMDGRTIGGRVVRVNEVKVRGGSGRSNYGRESFRRDHRDTDLDKGGVRRRENDSSKDVQHNDSWEHDGDKKRKYDHSRDHDNSIDHLRGRDRGQSKGADGWERPHSRNHDREFGRGRDLNARWLDRNVDHDRWDGRNKEHLRRKNSSSSYDRPSREPSSGSSDRYHRVEEHLNLLINRREELQQEKYDMEQRLDEKKQIIVDMQKRSMELEDSMASAKKLTLMRQMQLNKLYKCFQQVKEDVERVKSSEQKFQDLVDSVRLEIDPGSSHDGRNLSLLNGEV